jgi:nodulation protein E
MSTRRVAVTGLGVVSAIGNDIESFWVSLIEGRSGIGPIQSIDIGDLKFRNAAEVRGFDPLGYFSEKEAAQLDRFAQFAYAAAQQAVQDAGTVLPRNTAVVTGCATGGMTTREQSYREMYGENKTRYNPMTIPRVMESAAASLISMRMGVKGPVFNVTSACASSNHAIGQALMLMRAGVADAAICGGAEALIAMGLLRAWEAMRVVAPDTCRPFSKNRLGMVLGEGAGMLVLEDLEAARARGARIYCELAGCGMNADAGHWTQPSKESAIHAMQNAGVRREEVGYVNAHGTGTPLNDPIESAAIAEAFAPGRPAVSSTKSMHGHALGASGGLEAVATCLAMHRGVLPPTANMTELDPACAEVDVITMARPAQVEAAVSNSFAFGGLNCSLGFRAVR